MAKLTSIEINHLAELARIDLSEIEKEQLSLELPEIVKFVEQLGDVPGLDSDDEQSLVVLEKLRADEVKADRPQLSTEQLAALAPRKLDNNQLPVPAVFSEAKDA